MADINQVIKELNDKVEALTKRNIELEEELENCKAESKSKAQFFACASHDIRTPLNAIVGFCQLMCEEGMTDEDRAEFMQIIKMNSLTLTNLINDILDLSKIEAGHMNFNYTEFDVNELMKDIFESFEVQIKEGQKLIWENPIEPHLIHFDKQRFTQVLNNYLSNAIKFTEQGEITFGYKDEGDNLFVYVKDNGIGISEENKEKVFTQFQRFNKEVQGTGLGLSINKAIIERQGGEIGFESELNKGSRFWFRIKRFQQ